MPDAARRSLIKSGVIVVVFVVGYSIVPLRGDRWWLGAALGVAAIIGTLPITIRRLHAVRQSETPVLVALEAIVLLVTMLIVGFAAVYFAMANEAGQFEGLSTRVDAAYFTVTSLSTVGFGDVHAAGQAARLVVTFQILVNLVFLGVVVRVMARAAGTR